MARHKTRVTRRGRGRHSRKGRAGTRKQVGGVNWPWANKNPDAAVPADPNAVAAPPPGTEAAASDQKPWWRFGFGGGRRKSRKTRHRRRRHHRK